MSYKLHIQPEGLIFKTSTFIAEKGSVLHSGIYNRELTSSMAAGATLVGLGLIFADSIRLSLYFWGYLLTAFVALFLAFRYLVFRDPLLVLEVDKKAGQVTVTTKRGLCKRAQTFPLTDLIGIDMGYSVSEPQNPDGVKVVEGIALQHFTVIPGFGQPTEFYTLRLLKTNGEGVVIFATLDKTVAESLLKDLQDALLWPKPEAYS